jgi:hypothetical protein
MWAAREPSLRRSVQKTALLVVGFNSLYALALRYAFWWFT